jgi:hypothetical protein
VLDTVLDHAVAVSEFTHEIYGFRKKYGTASAHVVDLVRRAPIYHGVYGAAHIIAMQVITIEFALIGQHDGPVMLQFSGHVMQHIFLLARTAINTTYHIA